MTKLRSLVDTQSTMEKTLSVTAEIWVAQRSANNEKLDDQSEGLSGGPEKFEETVNVTPKI